MQASDRRPKTGGERPQKKGLEIRPLANQSGGGDRKRRVGLAKPFKIGTIRRIGIEKEGSSL